MKNRIILFVCLIITVLGVNALGQSGSNWPLKSEIDLSSGFGDFRQNRFHTGIDLRTGGKTGKKVYSPVDGYLYRVKMSYKGYGKGLYLMGDDGFIYVFAHLKDFAPKIKEPVLSEQYSTKRYYIDKYFPKGSIRIQAGEMIALSGQTGVGAPHLHFEKRAKENIPVNPLKNGYSLNEKVRPIFENITFKMVDDNSLFLNGERDTSFNVIPGGTSGEYHLESAVYLNRPFGLLVSAYDKMRSQGMKQSVYKLSVYYDDKLYYEVDFDSLNFDLQRSVNYEYDQVQAVDKKKNHRQLFHVKGNRYPGSNSPNSSDGIYGLKENIEYGYHKAKIVAEDCFGNRSLLKFDFIWGPKDNIFHLESSQVIDGQGTSFHLTPHPSWKKMKIDSVLVIRNLGDQWQSLQSSKAQLNDDGSLVFTAPTTKTNIIVLRLIVFSGKTIIWDDIFNGIKERGKRFAEIEHELNQDGLFVKITTDTRIGSISRLELYYRDSLLGIEYPQYITMNYHNCFIKPKKKYRRIDKIGFALTNNPEEKLMWSDSLNIFIAGYEDNEEVIIDNSFSIKFDKQTFAEPKFMEVSSNTPPQVLKNFNSKHYRILPEVLNCENDFELKMKMNPKFKRNKISGLCWLNEKKNKWVWLNNEFIDNTFHASSTGGGSFIVVVDYDPPIVSGLNIIDQKTYLDEDFAIRVNMNDSLSGIEDDRSILVRVDNEWLLPEYDPESGKLVATPQKKLSQGKHHLMIEIKDRVGNKYEQYLNFGIREKKNRDWNKPKGQ